MTMLVHEYAEFFRRLETLPFEEQVRELVFNIRQQDNKRRQLQSLTPGCVMSKPIILTWWFINWAAKNAQVLSDLSPDLVAIINQAKKDADDAQSSL